MVIVHKFASESWLNKPLATNIHDTLALKDKVIIPTCQERQHSYEQKYTLQLWSLTFLNLLSKRQTMHALPTNISFLEKE